MKSVLHFCLTCFLTVFAISAMHAQTLSSAKVGKLSLSEIEQEFYLKPYSIDSTKNWGKIKAKADTKNGKKIQLIHDGIVTDFCGVCQAEQLGFQVINFGSGDLAIEHLDAFITSYNETMQAPFKLNQQTATTVIFSAPLAEQVIIQSEATSDSTFHLALRLPELESTFGNFSDFIQLEFNFVDAAFLPLKTTYETVKMKGVILPNFRRETLILRLTIDLSKIPADYTKCFCKAIQQRYHLNVPISTIGMD